MSLIHLTKDNFQSQVLDCEKTVLVDFWATWCGPCRMIAPIVEQLAQERPDITVGKVDVDQEMELAVQYGISSIPTLMVFKGGQVTATALGYRPKEEIEALL